MRKKTLRAGLVLSVCLVFGACGKVNDEEPISPISGEPISSQAVVDSKTENSVAITDETLGSNAQDTVSVQDGERYIGEYVDLDGSEFTLEIAPGEDGKFNVEMGIYRLTNLDDGVGELTADGLLFTATDASGNPITALITLKDDEATVTFTDSTWELLPNGSEFTYNKTSEIPQLTQY